MGLWMKPEYQDESHGGKGRTCIKTHKDPSKLKVEM